MKAENYPVYKIFGKEFVLNIPNYQRPYSWSSDNVLTLIDDLVSFMNTWPDSHHPYFLGSSVLVKKEDPGAEVLDGQQRLATITMIIAVLRHLLEDQSEKKNLTEFLYEEGNTFTKTQRRYRLTLRDKEHAFFQNNVQKEEGVANLIKVDPNTLPDVQSLITANIIAIHNRLSDLNLQQRKEFAQFLMTRCYMVVVSTPDLDSAFRIFSVLNTRGLPLSPTDILKADLLAACPTKEQGAFASRWEDIEEQLGREDFEELFSHIRMIYRKAKSKDTLINEFHHYVKPKQDPIKFLDEVLEQYATLFSNIRNSNVMELDNDEHDETSRPLKWLNQIDNKDWLPPALAFLNAKPKEIDTKFFFRKLETLAASMMIRGAYENERIARYSKVLDLIFEQPEKLIQRDSPLHLTRSEQQHMLNIIGGDLYLTRTQIRRYVILRLDEAYTDSSANYNFKRFSIEHVLPQNPSIESEWAQIFSKEERKYFTNKICNLVPLSKRKNAKAGNLPFLKKKATYFSGKSTAFYLTKMIMEMPSWTPEILHQRQKEILEHAIRVWSMDIEILPT